MGAVLPFVPVHQRPQMEAARVGQMTPTEQDLARELAEHPAWRWAAGMRVCSPDGRARVDDDRLDEWEGWPDLADPATLGCIMVSIGDVKIDALDPWVQWRNADGSFSSTYSDTLGEALARAWLAVNGEDPKP